MRGSWETGVPSASKAPAMALIFQERILDLGTHGLLTLTQELGGYLPIPAQKHGHAQWHAPDGSVHDRMATCMRRCGTADLLGAVRAQQVRLAGAVASVKARNEWVAAQVDDAFLEAPGQVAALDGGRVLLVFGSVVGPHCIRVVDVVADRVLAEEGVDDLCVRLDVKRLVPGMAFEAIVHGSGGPWAGLWLGAGLELLCLRQGRLQRAVPQRVLDSLGRFALSPGAWFVSAYETQDIRIFSAAETTAAPRVVKSKHARKGSLFLEAALQADRCVLDHTGGVVEVLDGQGQSLLAVRPFPALARKENAGASKPSADGRYLLCGGGGLAALDLEWALQAEPLAPPPLPDYDRLAFKPEVLYRADQQATTRGLATLHRGHLQIVPWDQMSWSPALRVASRRTSAPQAAVAGTAAWAHLQRPAFRLQVMKRGAGLSQLYGQPHLPPAQPWPEYKGQPMALLCQIDLAAVATAGTAAPLPARGGLLVFAATDAEGEVAIDDLFNPAAVRVLCVPELAAQPRPAPAGAAQWPVRQALKPVASQAIWPEPDAALVQALGWGSASLDAYRQHLDSRVPEGAGEGHQLLGYPGLLQNNDLEMDAAREHELPGGPTAWRLLLQLDSDDTRMWGTDTGRLYLLIHEADLVAGDFSRVVALTQGL